MKLNVNQQHTAIQQSNVKKIQIIDVKITAPIVPTGIDFWASDKSPDLLEPDMKPSTTYKQYYGTVVAQRNTTSNLPTFD